MLYFKNDYSEGAHEKILQKLLETNMEQLPGYGTDHYTKSATDKIKTACQCPDADVYFITGGTQTNKLVISSLLTSYEGVISAATGHVNVHEAGAIEVSGHKVIELSQTDGKLSAKDVKQYLADFYADGNHEHMVFPGMVYISHPTEYGTLYTKEELAALSDVCNKFQIPLYLDGARLGYALACPESDVTLADIANLCSVFYIGGTKVGALCGEALVFTKRNTPKHFITLIKQNGALLAKGRLNSIQFDVLFTDNLYMEISKNAIVTARAVKETLHQKGYSMFLETPTNQTFVILDNKKLQQLQKEVSVDFWEKYDNTHTVVRFATSWATKMEDVEKLKEML